MIQRADRLVRVEAVLAWLGVEVPDSPTGRSVKVSCPLGAGHVDFGAEPALRVYPGSNSAYCFAETLYLAPSSLWARTQDLGRQEAAQDLLARTGIPVLRGWTRASDPGDVMAEAMAYAPDVDREALASALGIWARAHGLDWTSERDSKHKNRRGEIGERALEILARVRTPDEAGTWLDSAKAALKRVG